MILNAMMLTINMDDRDLELFVIMNSNTLEFRIADASNGFMFSW